MRPDASGLLRFLVGSKQFKEIGRARAIPFLAPFGLTPSRAGKLLDAFANKAADAVKENSYILMEKAEGFGSGKARGNKSLFNNRPHR